MDRHFLELMGKWLLEAARGQKQIEEMAELMGGGFEDFSRMVRKFYGPGGLLPLSADDERTRKRAMEDLKKSYHEWLNLMSLVPKSELKDLEKKCKSLEAKVASQQETIRHLKALLNEKGLPYADALKDFSEMMENQGRQFQELMESMGKAFDPD